MYLAQYIALDGYLVIFIREELTGFGVEEEKLSLPAGFDKMLYKQDDMLARS